jgi:hypothetical protein
MHPEPFPKWFHRIGNGFVLDPQFEQQPKGRCQKVCRNDNFYFGMSIKRALVDAHKLNGIVGTLPTCSFFQSPKETGGKVP